jgi:hypothetical protein
VPAFTARLNDLEVLASAISTSTTFHPHEHDGTFDDTDALRNIEDRRRGTTFRLRSALAMRKSPTSLWSRFVKRVSLSKMSQSYARVPDSERRQIERVICDTLNEVTRSQEHRFCWIEIVPQLVDHLSDAQAELVLWVRETWPKALARKNVKEPADDEIPF